MLLTALFLIVVLVSLTLLGYYRMGDKQIGEQGAREQVKPVNDYPVVSRKRELPDAAASFLFIAVMAARVQRSSRKQKQYR